MSGSDHEFDSLFVVEFPVVLRTVYLICQDYQRAQDITADAFVDLLRHWEKVSRVDSPGAWVRRVAIRLTLRSLRREMLRRRAESAIAPPPALAPSDVEVLNAIRKLPMRQRVAVVLFYVEDAFIGDIAAVLDCSPSTAGVHLHRGRSRLDLLGEVNADERRHAHR